MTLPSDAQPRRRKKTALIFCAVLLVIGAAFFLAWIFYLRFIAYTDDAYVEGNQVYITPLHPGFITAIHSDDTYLVKEGQVLVDLDTTDAAIALSQAQEKLAQTVRDVCQMFHQVFIYEAEIQIRKAEYIKSAQDYEHRKSVIAEGGVSREDFEHSIAFLSASFYALQMTELLYEKALSQVQGTSIRSHPLVIQAADEVRFAFVQLHRCRIYSPVEGLIAQRKIQVGMWVDAGRPLMSVIPMDQIWVNTNYKETQLKKMRIGQKVRLWSDLYGSDIEFVGTIAGLPGAAGNAFSLLPPQNLSGNWIKIVQRLPVRVTLDPEALKKHPLRIGLSMHAIVDLRDSQGLLVPISEKGSPTYQTPVYESEEQGDEEIISQIVEENLDPALSDFADTPINPATES